MDECWTNIDSTSFLVSAECCCVGLCLWDRHWTDWPSKHYNTGQSHGASVVSMLAHRPNDAGPTFGQRCRITIKPGALPSKHETLTRCCFNVGPTSGQHSNNNHLDYSIVIAGLMFLTGHVSYTDMYTQGRYMLDGAPVWHSVSRRGAGCCI